jgi:hypothetical protein
VAAFPSFSAIRIPLGGIIDFSSGQSVLYILKCISPQFFTFSNTFNSNAVSEQLLKRLPAMESPELSGNFQLFRLHAEALLPSPAANQGFTLSNA